jgi:hypothetical protein
MKTAIAPNEIEPLLKGSASDSPVSTALQNNSVTVSTPAANKVADKAADNYRIKQVKAVVTEIKKKRKGNLISNYHVVTPALSHPRGEGEKHGAQNPCSICV